MLSSEKIALKYKNILTFRIQNFLSSPKSVFIETKQLKWLTLWYDIVNVIL